MKINKLEYSTGIHADKKVVWQTLWDDSSYRAWAATFFEGCYVVADNWKEGNSVLFLGADKNGIYSNIEEHIPNKIIRFQHIGNVVNGEKQAIDDATKKWSGTTEVYSLTEKGGLLTLKIEIDVMDEHLDFMKDKLPKALEKIKSLAEN